MARRGAKSATTETVPRGISLNAAEFADCRQAALNRARRYIRKAFNTPGKTIIPRSEEEATQQAQADIDAMMLPFRPL